MQSDCCSRAHADKPGTIGIGIGSGTITNGLSGKYYTGGKLAFQANIGAVAGAGAGNRFGDFGGFGVSVDALIENPALVKTEFFTLDWNFGLGAGLGLAEDTLGLAGAGVLGLEINFIPIPLDLVLEYRPTLLIAPDVKLELVDFTGHVRYYFK